MRICAYKSWSTDRKKVEVVTTLENYGIASTYK